MGALKYIFEKASLSGGIARWQMLLAEYYIVFKTLKAIKGQALPVCSGVKGIFLTTIQRIQASKTVPSFLRVFICS
jgi:hypothetical protein